MDSISVAKATIICSGFIFQCVSHQPAVGRSSQDGFESLDNWPGSELGCLMAGRDCGHFQ